VNEIPLAEPMKGGLCDLARWLRETDIPCVLIGGIAASILGKPRLTQDIDVLAQLPEEQWEPFVQSAGQYGFAPRIADCVAFTRKSRVVLMRHEKSRIPVDIVLAGLPFETGIIAGARPQTLGGVTVLLPRPEDVIIMKSVAGRPHDIADIEGIATVQSHLDWAYISQWAGEFAAVLDRSEIVDIVARLRAASAARR